MILKASLHIHTSEDKKDGPMIKYNVYKLIDRAAEKGFNVLGYTPHQKFVFKEEFADYAYKKGIMLIPGVEKSLGRFLHNHVLILNCDKSVEKVRNFKQLYKYKAEHPEVFVIAAHPTYNRLLSIGSRNLKKHIGLFDAIEYSWVYSQRFNKNLKAEKIAKECHKPMISTSDVHMLRRLEVDYALISADDFTPQAVFEAIRHEQFENVTAPKKFLSIVKYISTILTRHLVRILIYDIFAVDPAKRLEPVMEAID
jgi:predicted metal-dependent phosphoesterase TrpH